MKKVHTKNMSNRNAKSSSSKNEDCKLPKISPAKAVPNSNSSGKAGQTPNRQQARKANSSTDPDTAAPLECSPPKSIQPSNVNKKPTPSKLPALSKGEKSNSSESSKPARENQTEAIPSPLGEVSEAQVATQISESNTDLQKVKEELLQKEKEELLQKELEAKRLAEEEALKQRKKELGNGMVKLIYEQYNEEFAIVDGSTTHANIDDVYCLSFVMPDCLIHLSALCPKDKREAEVNGSLDFFIEESPLGTYQGLEKDQTYYVYVEQKADQLARDQAKMRQIALTMEGAQSVSKSDKRDDGRVLESCSCVYGNPCVDEYGCKDWNNRFAIATKNGWKGF